jgi:hypothetical protein
MRKMVEFLMAAAGGGAGYVGELGALATRSVYVVYDLCVSRQVPPIMMVLSEEQEEELKGMMKWAAGGWLVDVRRMEARS